MVLSQPLQQRHPGLAQQRHPGLAVISRLPLRGMPTSLAGHRMSAGMPFVLRANLC